MTTEELIQASERILETYKSVVEDCTQKMRELLIKYNNNDVLYVDTNQTIQLDEASIGQMKIIISKIIMENNKQVRAQQQSQYRDIQTKPNKYGPENEYGKDEI